MLEQLGATTYGELSARVPDEYREPVDAPLPSKWYPDAAYAAMNEAYVQVRGFSDIESCRADFEAMGERTAHENLNGVYRALMRFMKSSGALAMLPLAWKQYFKASSCHTKRHGDGRATLTVRNASISYLAPVAVGWQRAALRIASGPQATVRECGFDEGRISADPMVYELTW
ncbi:MAG: hypothetical protein AAF799_02065 [Myxococcota bacterium]